MKDMIKGKVARGALRAFVAAKREPCGEILNRHLCVFGRRAEM